jgi:hypothetical protein
MGKYIPFESGGWSEGRRRLIEVTTGPFVVLPLLTEARVRIKQVTAHTGSKQYGIFDS